MSRRVANELALLVVAVIGAGAVGRLATGGAAWRGVVVTAIVGEAVTAVALKRVSRAWSAIIGTVAVALTAVWIAAPAGSERHGVPSFTTLRALGRALRAVGPVHFPVAGGIGVVLLSSLVAGVAAVGTRVLPGALGLVPSVVLLAGSTVALPSRGAALLAVALAGAGAVLTVARSAERAGALLGAGTALAALLCVAVVSSSTATGAAAGGGPQVAGVPPTALSLVSRLTALQVHDPDLVLFTAVTPLPTYWQVGSLSVLSGDRWVPDPATAAALAGRLRGSPPVGLPGGPTFRVSVTVANLSSRLLPVPPATTGVSGATLSSVGALASGPSLPGQRYAATATVPETNVSSDGATATGAAGPDISDTRLPGLPPVVGSLARSVTATASTPLEKAEALTNWFRSRLFHYSLTPTGANLVTFLTSSRTGSCEQFAGAFAVLARSVGLPTRVAIGFTTGRRDLAGQTVVRGIDAHAWPQVFLGGTWISFEPTPEHPSGELSPPGVIGLSGIGNPNPVAPTSLPGSLPGLSFPVPTEPAAGPVGHGGPGPWWWLVPLLGGALILGGATLLLRRRRRRRRTPGEQLVAAWAQVDRALARRQLGRPPWRTPVAHVEVLRTRMSDPEMGPVLDDLAWLAEGLEDEAYGPEAAGADDGAQARAVGRRVSRSLSSLSGGRS